MVMEMGGQPHFLTLDNATDRLTADKLSNGVKWRPLVYDYLLILLIGSVPQSCESHLKTGP